MNSELNTKIVDCISQYGFNTDEPVVETELKRIKEDLVPKLNNPDTFKTILNCIDLTTLNVQDNSTSVKTFVNKVNQFKANFKGMGNVAAICTWPSLIATVKASLSDPEVNICSVSAGFPDWHTFAEVKIAETHLAVLDGAEEIDVVINVGDIFDGSFDKVFDDISELKAACGNNKLKVILETGALKTLDNVKTASVIAMEAGADFIKTSTGKYDPAATPEAFYVMVQAIHEFKKKSGKSVGIKPAGGIAATDEALFYTAIVKDVLGEPWLNKSLFRIGASRLANDVLGRLTGKPITYF